MVGMTPQRNEWSLVALWFCVLYFTALAALFLGNYFVAPKVMLSEYDPTNMTRDDLSGIARAIGRGFWMQFVLTAIGVTALFAVAAWLQKQSNQRIS
jgi:hypothetical protein